MERIIFYSLPAIGHLISMVELTKLLLAQNPNLSITILLPNSPILSTQTSPHVSSYISSVSSVFPSISFHSLPFVPLLHKDFSNYADGEQIVYEIIRSSNPHVIDFLQSFCISSPVSAFILDFFCYSVLDIAKSFNIPTYFYFTTNASALSLFLNLPVFDKIASDTFRKLGSKLFEIPGLFSVPASHMLEPWLDRGVSYGEFLNLGAEFLKSDGIIVNTFESLEPRAVKALKQGTCLPGKIVPPVYCIGPLIASRDDDGDEKIGERNECLSWLDSQPNGSVVYLGFGSRGLHGKEQLREIAIGLEKSGVRFLWVVRAPPNKEHKVEPDFDSLLPVGFLDRTKDRGLVVKSWAPQIAVLEHKAIGGFVTHCGWNSILEAVHAGVPMVAWPLYAEQRFNKILLVDELRIALPMNESDDRFVSSDEIERRVKEIMSLEEGEVVRKRVKNLSDEAKVALHEGGSSRVEVTRLLLSWRL